MQVAESKTLLKLGVALGSALLSVFLLEVGLRLHHRFTFDPVDRQSADEFESYPYTDLGQTRRDQNMQAAMDWDPYLGYLPTAGFSGRGYRTNAEHLRYDEDLGSKPADELRVFVLGGSTAWGAGVRQEQTYAAVLERAFAGRPISAEHRVRVVPAGVSAWVSTQERTFLLNRLLDLEPDVVVSFTGANDVYSGYRGDRVLENQDYMEVRHSLRRSPVRKLDPGVDPSLLAGEDAPRFWEYRWKTLHRIDTLLYNLRRSKDPLPTEPLHRSVDEVAGDTIRNLEIMADAASRFDFELLVYLQPYLAVTAKPLTDWEQYLLDYSEHLYPGWPKYVRQTYPRYAEQLAAAAREEGLSFADADAAIAQEPESVFVDDFHLGDRGNRLIAEHLEPLVRTALNQHLAESSNLADESGRL